MILSIMAPQEISSIHSGAMLVLMSKGTATLPVSITLVFGCALPALVLPVIALFRMFGHAAIEEGSRL